MSECVRAIKKKKKKCRMRERKTGEWINKRSVEKTNEVSRKECQKTSE